MCHPRWFDVVTDSCGVGGLFAASVPVTVRRQSGTTPLTLSSSYTADLATLAPNWDVAQVHRLRVLHDTRRFQMSLAAVAVGPIAGGVLSHADEVVIETGELATGYQVNVPLDGALTTRTGSDELCATRATAAVYRPDARARLYGWRRRRSAVGAQDRSIRARGPPLVDARPTRPLPRSRCARLDLTTPEGRRWWSLARTLVEVAYDPAGCHPLVVRPLGPGGRLGAAGVHRPHGPLWAGRARTPSGFSHAVRRAAELVEADPERPWTSADLAREVGLSVRALQEGFARHLGSTPMGHVRAADSPAPTRSCCSPIPGRRAWPGSPPVGA